MEANNKGGKGKMFELKMWWNELIQRMYHEQLVKNIKELERKIEKEVKENAKSKSKN